MSWRGLSTRLAKIEAKRPSVSHLPIIIAQYPEEGAGRIVGLKVGDDVFPRLHDGQALADFALHIQNATGGTLPFNAPRIMIAVYARQN